jgi:hypothetical protein
MISGSRDVHHRRSDLYTFSILPPRLPQPESNALGVYRICSSLYSRTGLLRLQEAVKVACQVAIGAMQPNSTPVIRSKRKHEGQWELDATEDSGDRLFD